MSQNFGQVHNTSHAVNDIKHDNIIFVCARWTLLNCQVLGPGSERWLGGIDCKCIFPA